MYAVSIPGLGNLQLEFLVLDYNGTLAVDGILLPGVADALKLILKNLQVHVITADTFGKVRQQMDGLPVTVAILPRAQMEKTKVDYCRKLGLERTVAIGNGRNDSMKALRPKRSRTRALLLLLLYLRSNFCFTLSD